jgi:hypothetical protein
MFFSNVGISKRRKMNKTKIIAIAAVVLAIVGVGYYVYSSKNSSEQQAPSSQERRIISYSGQDGKSVCSILKESYKVETTESSFGEMVTSINGLASSDSEFWFYSINGTPGEMSCDKQMTTVSDHVVWEYKGM